MRTRQEYLEREALLLAPYACRAAESRGRVHSEPEHPLRSPFERDRDRVIHCSAFRRLEYKTQVFVNHEGDDYRTRLTHTLEAAQIARSVARFLRLNEDLVEALALAHDLGHPPFGHAGETALQELMAAHGGFEHNLQGLRVVDRLESRYREFPGLNLSWEVREGILKHSRDWDPEQPEFAGFGPARWPSLEAQVVDICDQIAYTAHDIDDGLAAGMIALDELSELSIWEVRGARCSVLGRDGDALWVDPNGLAPDAPSTEHRAPSTASEASPEQARYGFVRALINAFIADLVVAVEERLSAGSIKSPEAVRAAGDRIADFSPEMQACTDELREFLWARVYRHHRVYRMWIKARRVVNEIFRSYMEAPAQLPPPALRRIAEDGEARAICDYLAGLTDREALNEHSRLYNPRFPA
jgi:dGTPase